MADVGGEMKIQVLRPGSGEIRLSQVDGIRKTTMIAAQTAAGPAAFIGWLPPGLELCPIMDRVAFLRGFDLQIVEDFLGFLGCECVDLAVQLNGCSLRFTRLDRDCAVLGGEGKSASRVHIEALLRMIFELVTV